MERRYLTVLFCDLVGSTQLSTALDPEDLADIIIAYREVMQARVATVGGTVAQYVGDGLLAYFGYPHAQDDDAAHAVSAALSMLTSMPLLNARFGGHLAVPLGIRIGIHSGLTLIEVNDGSGAGLANVGAIGQTPNVAARLQALAAPGTALVSGATHALTATVFEYEAGGEATLKGVSGAVAVFRPVRDRRSPGRHARSAPVGQVNGRAKEYEQLCRAWSATKSGRGAAVLLTGDPGLGKSFIANQVIRQAEADGGVVLQFTCQFDATHSPFRAVLVGLQRQLLMTSGSAVAKAARLQRTLRRHGADTDDLLALLCEFFSLPSPVAAPMPRLTPEGRLRLLRDLLFGRLDQIGAHRPVLIMVENAHWADPSSEEWLSELVRRVRQRRIMVVVTARPQLDAAWDGEPFVNRIRLERLDQVTMERILSVLEAGHKLEPEVRQAILDRSDGVPLFLEELFKTVAEGHMVEKERFGVEEIPGSLRSMLTARLDRLGAAKPIAGSVKNLGRYGASWNAWWPKRLSRTAALT